MKVITDNKWKPFLNRNEVPGKVIKEEFDWLDSDDYTGFFKYRGEWYSIDDFLIAHDEHSSIKDWPAIRPDSYFSGLVLKVDQSGDNYKIGRYYS